MNMTEGEQLSLFEEQKPKPKEIPEEVNEYALVYLVTFAGGAQGNLFILKTDDAQKLCEDECSHGVGRGGHWMFNWTALSHFAKEDDAAAQHQNVHGELEPFEFVFDTGKQDKDFERLGIKKPSIDEMDALLNRLGYRYHHKNAKERSIEKGLTTEKEWRETEKFIEEQTKSGKTKEFLRKTEQKGE